MKKNVFLVTMLVALFVFALGAGSVFAGNESVVFEESFQSEAALENWTCQDGVTAVYDFCNLRSQENFL